MWFLKNSNKLMSGLKNFFKRSKSVSHSFISPKLEIILGFKIGSPVYYELAFLHKSEHKTNAEGHPQNYERLEFLGDAVLGMIIANFLYHKVPEGNEGYLTEMRSKIVSRAHLNELGKELNLQQFLRTEDSSSQFGENVHGNLFEALVGAIYLDKGYPACESFIFRRVINPHVDISKLESKVLSYKGLLVEWCQKNKIQFEFVSDEDSGNDSIKHFTAKLFLDGKLIAKARETSKKKAEEKSARRAYYSLQKNIKS